MVLASLAEVVSLGAVIPFLGALMSPEKVYGHALAQPFVSLLSIDSPRSLILPLTLIFVGAAIIAGLFRILLIRIQAIFSATIGSGFSVKVYELIVHEPYEKQVARNSSEALADVSKAQSLVGNLIQPLLNIISSSLILIAVIVSLLIIEPIITLTVFLGFGFIYICVVFLTRRNLATNSKVIAKQGGLVNKAIQEGLGGIRDVLIDGTQSVFVEQYKAAMYPLQSAVASNSVIAAIPRYGIESLGITLIAAVAYLMFINAPGQDGTTVAIPVLGTIALGAQRVFPLLQQIYSAYVSLKGSIASNQDALFILDKPLPEHALGAGIIPIPFEREIQLINLGFRYSAYGPWIFRGLNLSFRQGSRIGFMGSTGSGKSTFLDVMMGLLLPTEGNISVDGRRLADSSIAENIAFGVALELIDWERVQEVAKRAQIHKTILNWPQGYKTLVGERGVRLSGGQRQRIAIARALYKKSSVIIFDEATSALDNETEHEVMEAIHGLGKEFTIFMIAHRLTTLKRCDQVFELVDGSIRFEGGYEDLVVPAA
ncbi:MAG: ABC transporter ATP-binding protein [Micrococcales bacterium]|nr:ABC transporter ATP-binding protein [Micrococcales bacterium]